MKKKLLLLVITFSFALQTQAQSAQELFGAGVSLFGSSKKQKKIEREKFVIDSTNNAVAANKKKRETFVRDSILNIEYVNRQNALIKAKELEEKKKTEWYYDHYLENPYSFTFNKTIVSYFVGENIDSPMIAMDIFSDSTTTKKIGSIKLNQILPTEVFAVMAYNSYNNEYLVKSKKDNKICVINENVKSYQNWGKVNGAVLTTEYINPDILAKEKLIVSNYRLKLNNAKSTVAKLEAIHAKHLYQRVNSSGVVVEKGYKVDKFTVQEKVTYKQLIQKLKVQRDAINIELDKKVGYKKTLRGLLDIPDISKQMEIEHAYNDYSYYALNW
jgi:hypothetical protein